MMRTTKEDAMRFRDRVDAGQQLAKLLADRELGADPIVLALPRGGVPVGEQISHALHAPLEVVGVRKLGAPGQPELGVGAIGEGGARYVDQDMLRRLGLTESDLEATVAAEEAELERRVARYRGDRPLPDLAGRTAIIVDDGLATGVTARAAVRAVRAAGAPRVLLAVPTCSPQGRMTLAGEADEVVCVIAPERFAAVGQWYDRFDQTSDDEVMAALDRSRAHLAAGEEH
jgi:putative phosphoribosyl transferase